jgi:ABC-type multidrug transport system ATPase subunit/pSer/pThr/pTyr-binding forkhead associated (FHA) protein
MTADSLIIGRDGDRCNVIVDGAGVSAVHCRILRDPVRGFVVEDLNASNGTFVDGVPVPRGGTLPLRIGQTLGLGQSTRRLFDAELAGRLAGGIGSRTMLVEEPRSQGARAWILGRDPECDVVVDVATVSGRHARLTQVPGGYRVDDLGSSNGIGVNAPANRVNSATVTAHDTLYLGGYPYPVSRFEARIGAEVARLDVAEQKAVFVLGRTPEAADVVVDAPTVSSRHAEVRRTGPRVEIRDLGSTNGTFVNGERIGTAWHEVLEGAVVMLGSVGVDLRVPGKPVPTFRDGYSITVQQLGFEVPDGSGGRRAILSNVNFTVLPGEFVGLMGPSGCGKTTLLTCANGYVHPGSGRVLINGQDFLAGYDAFRHVIGYVPQEDIVYPQLTVRESLRFTARLRLPEDYSDAEVERRIDEVLDQLEIRHTENTLIGDKDNKGISGGQRKRVNLAQELLSQPKVLFLDEPTSGLSSEDTLSVMTLLRELANGGCTIILTIHQPSLEAYRQLDNLILLCRGQLVYYGPAYPDAIEYMNPAGAEGGRPPGLMSDPGSVLKPLTADERGAKPLEAARRRAAAYLASPLADLYVTRRAESRDRPRHSPGGHLMRASLVRQARILAVRGLTLRFKDRVNAAVVLGQAPVIGCFIWLMFREPGGDTLDLLRLFDTVPRVLFLAVVAAVWLGCSNAIREIVGERAIFRRERMVNLRIVSYLASKVSVLSLIGLVQTLTLLLPLWLGFGLRGPALFFELWATLWLAALAATALGLAISSAFRSPEAAVSLLPLVLIPQVLAAGSIVSIADMSLPARAVASLTVTRWGFEAALRSTYGDVNPEAILHACHEVDEAAVRRADASGLRRRAGELTWGCLEGNPARCPSAIREPELREATCEGSGAALDASTRLEQERVGVETGERRARRHALCGQICTAIDLDQPIAPVEQVYGVAGSPLREVERLGEVARKRADAPPQRPLLEEARAARTVVSHAAVSGWFMIYLLLTAILLRRQDRSGVRR